MKFLARFLEALGHEQGLKAGRPPHGSSPHGPRVVCSLRPAGRTSLQLTVPEVLNPSSALRRQTAPLLGEVHSGRWPTTELFHSPTLLHIFLAPFLFSKVLEIFFPLMALLSFLSLEFTLPPPFFHSHFGKGYQETEISGQPATACPSNVLIFDLWHGLLSLQCPQKTANSSMNSDKTSTVKQCLTWSL